MRDCSWCKHAIWEWEYFNDGLGRGKFWFIVGCKKDNPCEDESECEDYEEANDDPEID